MKKHVFLLAILMMTVQWVDAQKVTVPKFEKFVMINKDGVNLRKAPNTQSARLMSKTEEVEFMYSTTLSWTSRPGMRPFNFEKGTVVPVLGTSGDWLHIYVNVNDMVSSNKMSAYIRQDFCTPVEPVQMQTGSEAPYIQDVGQPYKVEGNKGLYVSYYQNDMEGNDAMIGKALGNGVVWFSYNDFYTYLSSICSEDEYGGISMDMKKITEARVLQFINSHSNPYCMGISYQFNTGTDSPISMWSFDTKDTFLPFLNFNSISSISSE